MTPSRPLSRRLLQPFMPPIETLRRYNAHKLHKDIVAGLTVSVVEVPQAMAYAIIAGVPPVYGLYTSIIQGFVGALLSSSEHMTTGPTNTQSLLIASAVHRIVSPNADPAQYLELVVALTMLKGLIQLSFAAAQMGNMIRYVSRSVISGLVSGAGLLIFFGQMPPFFGIRGHLSDPWPGIVGPIQRVAHFWHEFNPRAVAIGLAAACVSVAGRLIHRFFPGYLVAVVAAAVAVGAAGWTGGQLPLIDNLPPSFPNFAVPHLTWALAEQLFGGALALAIIGMLESVAIAKSIAAHTGEEISANQEFFAQGLKNFLSSFWHCIPGSGSFTRSALDHAAGAETRFAAVFNAMFVAATFFLFGRWAHYIPRAALGGVLFVIAYRLIDWRHFARLVRTSRSDSVVCLVTFAATLLAPLEYAIFIGIFLNIGLYLRQAARLHLLELARMPDGRFVERPWSDPTTTAPSEVTVLQIEGNLFFGLADELDDRLARLAHNTGVHVVVIRLKRVHAIDATVLHVLERFVTRMHDRQAHVIICGVRPHLQSTLHAYGVVDLIGPTNVFPAGPGVFESAARAIVRAVALSQARHAGQPCGDQRTETESPLLYDI